VDERVGRVVVVGIIEIPWGSEVVRKSSFAERGREGHKARQGRGRVRERYGGRHPRMRRLVV
jgi:hypothetical protein